MDTAYAAGDELFVQDVTVSVLNASSREGLAGRTLQELEDAGFPGGQTANAPTGTTVNRPAEIWVSDPDNPGAQLLRAWLGKVPIRSDLVSRTAGITLVVGDRFEALKARPPLARAGGRRGGVQSPVGVAVVGIGRVRTATARAGHVR